MQINEIQVTIDARIKIIEFESISPNITIKAKLDESDDPAKCTSELYRIAEREWAKQALRQVRWIRTRVTDKEKYDSLAQETMDALKKLIA